MVAQNTKMKNIICTEFRSEGYFPDQDGGQLQRKLEYHYAICPVSADVTENDLARKAEAFNIPLKPIQTNVPNSTKGDLPTSYSFYEVKGNAQVSCLKKAEEGDAVVMRLFNPGSSTEEVTVQWCRDIQKAELLDLKEEVKEELKAEGGSVKLTIPSNKICTVKFTM